VVYDEALAERIRTQLFGRTDVEEKRMFGGLTFMVAGNMCVGIVEEDLMVRVGPDRHEKALARPHARPMDFTKRTPKGFVFVGPEGVARDGDLQRWVTWAIDFVESLAKRS
jgi:TfoX/Sxy family transcriptional regulator of competence genes